MKRLKFLLIFLAGFACLLAAIYLLRGDSAHLCRDKVRATNCEEGK
jgi:hypothetical protein